MSAASMEAQKVNAVKAIRAAAAVVPDVERFARWLRATPSYEERLADLEGAP